ncbi:MAG: diacylglycerol kinase family protein [Thermodesulfovibrionaceae bacterium]
MRRVFLIGNPVAGGGCLKKIKKAENILKEKGVYLESVLTKSQGDAETLAREIKEKEKDALVIVAGGDGTYNEVANGLCYSKIPMAILPMGTTSVLAKELKVPNSIEKAIDIALNGKVYRVHLGKVKSSQKERLFVLMVGVGFDGETVYGVNQRSKFKKLSYILSGVKTFFSYKPTKIILKNSESIECYSAVVAKASCYGGSFKISPDADLRKPFFYTFASNTKSKFFLATQIIGVIFGFHLKIKNAIYFRSENLKILGDAHVQIDGDYFGKTPIEVSIIKDAISLVFPQ